MSENVRIELEDEKINGNDVDTNYEELMEDGANDEVNLLTIKPSFQRKNNNIHNHDIVRSISQWIYWIRKSYGMSHNHHMVDNKMGHWNLKKWLLVEFC